MKNDIKSYIASFSDYLLYELNYSKKTATTYTQNLKTYTKFLEKYQINFLNVTIDHAEKYKAYLISSNFDNKTSSLNLSATRSFYNYLLDIKMVSSNPFFNLKNPKIAKKLPNFLKTSETKNMLTNTPTDDLLTQRNIFIVEFLYATGIRVSELCAIKLDDILMSDKSIRIFGKGSKERIVYFSALDPKLFDNYLNVIRPKLLNGTTSEYLIINNKGKPITPRSIELIVKKYSITHNIKSKVTPHTLRHTYATDLLNNGADIRSVGELLGHESLSTTQIYTHITNERLKKVYNNTHPQAKK